MTLFTYARTLHTEQLCFLFPHPPTPETRTREAIRFTSVTVTARCSGGYPRGDGNK